MSSIMRRRRGLNSAISLLLFQRLRFNSRNPSKQKPQPQTDPPNAASAASFNPDSHDPYAAIDSVLGFPRVSGYVIDKSEALTSR
jgi:hypothetical protein